MQPMADQKTSQISNFIVDSLQAHGSSIGVNEYSSDCLHLVRAVLRASPEEGEGIARRSQVLKGAVLWLVQAGDDPSTRSGGGGGNHTQIDEVAGKLVNALIDVGQSFSLEALVKSILTVTDTVRHQCHPHGQTFALFSRLLIITSKADSVCMPDSAEEISGSEFRDIILDRICTAPWNHRSVIPLTAALADVEMESKQLEMTIIKILKQFKTVDAADLPVLLYNLLLMSSKGHRRLVLRGMLEFFDRLNNGGAIAESLRSENPRGAAHLPFAELSVIESTAILHFSFAVKQDQELGMELLKHMKNGKTAYLSSFSLTCLMTMARIHRFEDGVMDYIKSSILTIFKDTERMQRECWVSQFEGMSPPPILELLRNIIRKLPFGLEQLTPSIVHCGVYIMDSSVSTAHWKASDKDTMKKLTPKTPSEQACELGAIILAEVFKTQTSARTEILDHIMSRIVTKSASTSFFLDLLETIVSESPDALEEHLPKIKESLHYLSFLSLATAVRLMTAVKDVAKTKRSFRDSLTLVLRKALFSKNLESRQVALSGFLLLLGPSAKQQQSLRGGSSRLGVYQTSDSELSNYSMEILGMLRRCMGQQGEIRHSLYIGLMELVETTPNLAPIVFEILQAHFVHFYDKTGTRLTPLLLEECVDDISADEYQVTDCLRDLDRIVLGLQQVGLEDFELDKTSDFNMATNIGARNNMYATLLSGCYEAAIEYVVLKQQPVTESSVALGKSKAHPQSHHQHSVALANGSAELILHLFGKMRKLHDIVKEKVVIKRGKKIGPLGEASVLGLECVTRLMECVFAEQNEGASPDAETLRLRSNEDFVYYITTVVHVLLVKLHTSAEVLKDSEYDYCRRLSIVLVREFIVSNRVDGPKAMAAGAKGKDKNNVLSGSTIPMDLQSRKVTCNFLAATLPQVNGGYKQGQQASEVVAWTTSRTIRYDIDSLAAAFIQYLQELLVMFVNETIPLLKEAGGLLKMIQILSKYLARTKDGSSDQAILPRADSAMNPVSVATDSSQLEQLVQWLVMVCRDQAVDDAALTKSLLSMLLQLEQEYPPTSNVHNQTESSLTSASSSMMHGSFGFGNVTASSVTLQRPEAATRLRLAGDVLLTFGMNVGGPDTPSLHDLPDTIPAGQKMDEETLRLIQLKQEIGVEPQFAVVTLRTSGAVTDVLLQQIDRSLEGLEWALSKLRFCGLGLSGSECTEQSTNDNLAQQQHQMASNGPMASDHIESYVLDIHASCLPNQCKATKKSFKEFETEICWRLEICLWVLVRISQACIGQTTSETLIKVLHRCYRTLTALTKYYLTPSKVAPLDLFESSSSSSLSISTSPTNGHQRKAASKNNVIQLPHGFLRVTQVAGTELSKHLYSFLSYFQMLDVEQKERAQERQGGGYKGKNGADDKGKNKGKGKDSMDDAQVLGGNNNNAFGGGVKSRQKAKILRESKLIPTLIFDVEQYERYVIQLSKKSQVNLTQFMRRSTARDFRIQIQRLGNLGLEDRYDEERQQLLMLRQEQQRQQQQHHEYEDGDAQMVGDMDTTVHEEEQDNEEEDEESLVRNRKRAKHDI
ncbi:hypothetical protein BGZ51_001704 [Haplosporangium sp. Z 767]|nr:hypothetical protein BGZ51_001704 [Haplosporangium sp. Z 767]